MQMVRLTTCADGFEARLVAARLGSEGVVWSLRGGHDGPFTFGSVDVLVDADDLAVAREVLGGAVDGVVGADGDLELADAGAVPERETTGRDVLLMVGVFVLVALFAAARVLGG